MLPGLWGAPCKAVSAFAPPINTQDFNLAPQTVHAQYTDYEEGMRAAAAAGKPVLLDFTGSDVLTVVRWRQPFGLIHV